MYYMYVYTSTGCLYSFMCLLYCYVLSVGNKSICVLRAILCQSEPSAQGVERVHVSLYCLLEKLHVAHTHAHTHIHTLTHTLTHTHTHTLTHTHTHIHTHTHSHTHTQTHTHTLQREERKFPTAPEETRGSGQSNAPISRHCTNAASHQTSSSHERNPQTNISRRPQSWTDGVNAQSDRRG